MNLSNPCINSFSTLFMNTVQCILLAFPIIHSSSFILSVCTRLYWNLFSSLFCSFCLLLSSHTPFNLLFQGWFLFGSSLGRFFLFTPLSQYRIKYPKVHSLILCSLAIFLIDFPLVRSSVIISFNNVILCPTSFSLVLVILILFLPFYYYLYWFIAGL